MGRSAPCRFPKLLNTDISTTAITSHSNRFFVRLFKADLYSSRFKPRSHCATPRRQLQHLWTDGLLTSVASADKAFGEQKDFSTLGAGRTGLARRHLLEAPPQTRRKTFKTHPVKRL